MFDWFKKKIDAKDYFRRTKKVYIDGVIFWIKPISADDHLSGLDVILKIWDKYRRDKKASKPEDFVDDMKKIKKFCRDIIYAGVVKPELTMKKEETGEKIHIDEILSDIILSQKLAEEIISYSYGKKK